MLKTNKQTMITKQLSCVRNKTANLYLLLEYFKTDANSD